MGIHWSDTSVSDLMAVSDDSAPTIGYARVSGHRQQDDLKRQQEMQRGRERLAHATHHGPGFGIELSQGWRVH